MNRIGVVIQKLAHMDDEECRLFNLAADAAREELSPPDGRDRDIFITRLAHYWQDLYRGLRPPYEGRDDLEDFVVRLVRILAAAYTDRSEELKRLDLERSLGPGWFQNERRVGYVLYTDLFAGDLRGVAGRRDYLQELGANYIHLMPLLKPRPGPNDGGYAVQDYKQVNPDLGTIEDLEDLCSLLRAQDTSVCLDLRRWTGTGPREEISRARWRIVSSSASATSSRLESELPT